MITAMALNNLSTTIHNSSSEPWIIFERLFSAIPVIIQQLLIMMDIFYRNEHKMNYVANRDRFTANVWINSTVVD